MRGFSARLTQLQTIIQVCIGIFKWASLSRTLVVIYLVRYIVTYLTLFLSTPLNYYSAISAVVDVPLLLLLRPKLLPHESGSLAKLEIHMHTHSDGHE